MDASKGMERAAVRRRWLRAAAVAGTAAAVACIAVLARIEAPPPGLMIERRTPDPAPSPPPPTERVWVAGGGWRRMALAPVSGRSGHVAQWTGACPAGARPRTCGELLVWGGWSGRQALADGAAYDPAADAWRGLPEAPRRALVDVPLPGVWTGRRHEAASVTDPERHGELVVWGATDADLGHPDGDPEAPRGVALNPLAGTWRALPDAPIAPRVGHSMTWTGEEVVVWGGHMATAGQPRRAFADGAAYDPSADSWRLLPPAPLRARSGHVALYLPGEDAMFFWGGAGEPAQAPTASAAGDGWYAGRRMLNDGALFDLDKRRWRRLPPLPLVPARLPGQAAAAWTAGEDEGVLLVAALVDGDGRPALAHYSVGSDAWRIRPPGPVGLRSGAQTTGDGHVLVVWGGSQPLDGEVAPAAAYHTSTGGWRRVADPHRPRPGDRAVWTGSELLVWGAGADGAVFDPDAQLGAEPGAQAAGEQRTVQLPAESTTNWPLAPAPGGDAVAVTVRGAGAADIEVWLTTGRGRQATRREPVRVECTGADTCEHRFAPVPPLIPGLLRLHLAYPDAEAAMLRVMREELP